MAYHWWKFPCIETPSGLVELRILRVAVTGDLLTSTGRQFEDVWGRHRTIYLDNCVNVWTGFSSLKRRLSDEEGRLVADEVTLNFVDAFSYTGLTGAADSTTVATPVTVDLDPDNSSVLAEIFSDPDAEYNCWLVNHPYGGGTAEVFFAGSFDARSIHYTHDPVHTPHTDTEQKGQICTVKAFSVAGRLKKVTVADFMESTLEGQYAFTSGYTISNLADRYADGSWSTLYDHAQEVFSTPSGSSHWDFALFSPPGPGGAYSSWPYLGSGGWSDWLAPATAYTDNYATGGDSWQSGSFPLNLWGAKIVNIIAAIAAKADLAFTPATDVNPAITYTGNNFDNAGVGWIDTDLIDVTDIVVCVTYLWGINPIQGTGWTQDFKSPMTYDSTQTGSDIIRDLCLQFGTIMDIDYDQTLPTYGGSAPFVTSYGKPHLRLTSRLADQGSMPTTWTLATQSAEEPVAVSKSYVLIKQRGFSTKLKCPAGAVGEAVEIELPFGVRPYGNVPGSTKVIEDKHLIYDTSASICEQRKYVRVYADAADDFVNPESWVGHSFMFTKSAPGYDYPNTTSMGAFSALWYQYPGFAAQTNPQPTGKRDTWHYSALRQASEIADLDTRKRYDVYYSAAQLYAQELLGNRRIIKRSYIGCADDSGSLRAIKPGIRCTFWHFGKVRLWKWIETEQDICSGITQVVMQEIITDDEGAELPLGELPVEWITGSPEIVTTGGTGSVNNPSGGSSSTSSSVCPCTTVRVVSVTDVTLSGTPNIDRVNTAVGDKVLLAGQADAKENGVWIVKSGAWERDTSTVIRENLHVRVRRGQVYQDTLWCLVSDSVVVGSDDLVFEQITHRDVGQYVFAVDGDSYNFCAGIIPSYDITLLPKVGACDWHYVPLNFTQITAARSLFTPGLTSWSLAPELTGDRLIYANILMSSSSDLAHTQGFEPPGLYGAAPNVPTGWMNPVGYPQIELALFVDNAYACRLQRSIIEPYQLEQTLQGHAAWHLFGSRLSSDDDASGYTPSIYDVRIANLSTTTTVFATISDVRVTEVEGTRR